MLKIRLARVGKKKQPAYRVVVADARAPRDGAYVEIIGHYNPRTEPSTFVIDHDKVRDWMHKGAQPTERIHRLLANEGILPPLVRTVPRPKTQPKAATATAEAEPEAAAEESEA